MVCAYYYVKVYDKNKGLLAVEKVYSFDEAFYRISNLREFIPNGYYFTIEYTDS